MKTSNKLIAGIVGFILLSMFGLVLMGRMSITTVKSEQMVGNGNLSEEYRTVSPFKGLKIGSGMQATLKKGENQVILKTDENLLEFIETTVDNEELTIRWKSGFHYDGKPVQVMIAMPAMNYLSASSGSRVTTTDDFVGKSVHVYASSGSSVGLQGLAVESLEMDLSSSSTVDVAGAVKVEGKTNIGLSSGSQLTVGTLATEQLDADMSSSSGLKISGTAESLIADGGSGARFEGMNFLVQNATIDGSSSAFFEITVSEDLNVDLSSGSVVRYAGNATVVQNLSSGSSVRKVD